MSNSTRAKSRRTKRAHLLRSGRGVMDSQHSGNRIGLIHEKSKGAI